MFLGSRISYRGSAWGDAFAFLGLAALICGTVALGVLASNHERARLASLSPAEKQQVIDGRTLALSAKVGDYIVTSGGVLVLVRDAYDTVDENVMTPKVINCATGQFGVLSLAPYNTQKFTGLILAKDGKEDPAGRALCESQNIALSRTIP